MNLQSLGLTLDLEFNSDKCKIYVEAKIIKKSCFSVSRETELMSLIHTVLDDLRQTMTKVGKRYHVTFIDDFSDLLNCICSEIKMMFYC